MDYYLRIQKSIDFIEANLCEHISLTEVSKQAYSSLSHFHRIFAFMTGFTIKEYKNLYEDDSIEIRFVTFTKFIVAGYCIHTSLENNKVGKDIPFLWETFFKDKLYEKIPTIINPDQFYGIYSNLDFHNNFIFAICYEIKNLKGIPSNMYQNN